MINIIRKIANHYLHDNLLHLTTVGNVERSIQRHKKQNLGSIPQNLNNLQLCLLKENRKQLLKIDADAFVIESIIKNNDTKTIIFIDKTLTNKIMDTNEEKIIFVDGTFATVPQLKNTNCQMWTIIMRHKNRVNKTNN